MHTCTSFVALYLPVYMNSYIYSRAIRSRLLKRHNRIPERSTRVSAPHRTERLEEGKAIPSLADGECPERRRRNQLP